LSQTLFDFGVGIEPSTAILVRGRRMQVVGKGEVTLTLAKCDYREHEQVRLQSPSTADLTQWTRAARTRHLGIDPGTPRLGQPQVQSGSLVIVGGGRMPQSVADRFIELAGGPEARIVYLPTAVPRDEARKQGVPRFLQQAEIADVTVLPQMGRREVAEPAFQEALKSATGIWFGGGRQWNFVDAYEGTNAIQLFHNVLARGGVIGGNSAGATIQGEFLVRGHPLGNTIMMAEGYERGFGFLPGTAIDQHFAQRRRQPDLIPVVRQHPKLLGIGIDESTALIVQGHTAEVLGDHAAHFLTSDKLPTADTAAANFATFYHTVKSGESFDLRKIANLDKEPIAN
ncbi:MAG: cyanophycinase, partial [Planctomycetales bacterium]|nr:cyanophycinase [Planctomycetales bacterium]